MSDRVTVSLDDHVAHVLLNRPDKRNALDEGMFEGVLAAARQLADEPGVRAVVLSGAGHSFCAGLDFANFGNMASGALSAETDSVRAAAADLSADGANRAQQLGWLWQELPVPVIAAVQGAAYGGGLHIALGADIRFVAPDAKLAFVEITWGLIPDMGGTQALRRLVPLDAAKKMVFSGEPISGVRAVEIGLGTELSEQPLEDAFALARTIAQRSPDAVRAAKRVLNASALVPLEQGFANEFGASAALMGSPNQTESVRAKLEKRAPRFEDALPADPAS